LKGYPKTTGGDGMHIYIPVEPIYSYEQVRNFAEILTHLALDRAPKSVYHAAHRSRSARKIGFISIICRSAPGKTISAPYVVRAYDGAPVATPLHWKEVVSGLRPTILGSTTQWNGFAK
jgi:bifunctional non-homologous end joining protein LigD